jgi:hypothetical protein
MVYTLALLPTIRIIVIEYVKFSIVFSGIYGQELWGTSGRSKRLDIFMSGSAESL